MDYFEFMKQSCEVEGLSLDENKYHQFITYKDLLQEWNKKINLTAIIEDEDIIKKHFVDCIKIFRADFLKNAKNVIDVGTGAGFPGIPMKILMPQINVTLLDSLNKRLIFLNEVINKLDLINIKTVHGRAEDFGRDVQYRQKYDVAVSRAVANLAVLAEFCLPFVKVGGYFVAMKGPAIEEEIVNGKVAIARLGGKIQDICKVPIEGTELHHNLVIVKKIKATKGEFPRKAGIVVKNPLK